MRKTNKLLIICIALIVALCTSITMLIVYTRKINALNETIENDNLWLEILEDEVNYWYDKATKE